MYLEYLNTLPFALQHCYHYFENYVSCFHPKSLFQRQMKQCLDSWKKLKQTVTSYPIRHYQHQRQQSNGDEEEDKIIYKYKRNDNTELTDRLQALLEIFDKIIQTNFCGFSSIFTLTESSISSNSHPFHSDKLFPFETLNCSPVELTKISLFKCMVKELDQILVGLKIKMDRSVMMINEGNASRRTQDSFYKFLGCMDNLFLILTLCLRLVEAEFSNDNKLTTNSNDTCNNTHHDDLNSGKDTKKRIKSLNHIIAFLQRAKLRVSENMWTTILEEFVELLPALEKMYRGKLSII
jgi:hypothetical protein